MESKVVNIIIEFLNGCKNEGRIVDDNKDEYCAITNCHYLLGQIIRNYHIEYNHYFISENALDLWKKITDEPFFHYWYRDKVLMTKEESIIVYEYVGNSKKFNERLLKKGDKFTFRDVFHDEHIVPIKMILDELLSLDSPNYDNVKKILDKIYICRMLKSEDRKLVNKYNRSTDINEVLKTDYKDIELIQLQSWNQKF